MVNMCCIGDEKSGAAEGMSIAAFLGSSVNCLASRNTLILVIFYRQNSATLIRTMFFLEAVMELQNEGRLRVLRGLVCVL